MKILVNVHIPAISESFDILVPKTMRIKTFAKLVAETVEDLSNHTYSASGRENICSVEKNILLRPNTTFEHYGIRNGDHLVVI